MYSYIVCDVVMYMHVGDSKKIIVKPMLSQVVIHFYLTHDLSAARIIQNQHSLQWQQIIALRISYLCSYNLRFEVCVLGRYGGWRTASWWTWTNVRTAPSSVATATSSSTRIPRTTSRVTSSISGRCARVYVCIYANILLAFTAHNTYLRRR